MRRGGSNGEVHGDGYHRMFKDELKGVPRDELETGENLLDAEEFSSPFLSFSVSSHLLRPVPDPS